MWIFAISTRAPGSSARSRGILAGHAVGARSNPVGCSRASSASPAGHHHGRASDVAPQRADGWWPDLIARFDCVMDVSATSLPGRHLLQDLKVIRESASPVGIANKLELAIAGTVNFSDEPRVITNGPHLESLDASQVFLIGW